MSATVSTGHQVPFLGLHYFDEENEEIFFGREEQLRDLLRKLEFAHFVTVIGSSGTGKSSLVRAGLIPALRRGFLPGAGCSWRILKMRPGKAPIANLATELENEFRKSDLELTLRRGPLGLLQAAQQCGLKASENLLVLVDQFEELFTYQREAKDRHAAGDECAAFVKLILEASATREMPVFVLITMRSDYLGACAQFRDLPERINSGLYLIPRMRRDQLEEAIVGPAAISGATFSPALVQRLLNDAGEDPDQLPVLQHALLRAWLEWKRQGQPDRQISFQHYDDTGGVRQGLNKHANEIYGHLPAGDQKIAELMFRSLTERDPANNDIRRPTEVAVIAKIAGVQTSDVRRVADSFRGEGVSFLMPVAPVELADETVLDITHESLIRKWDKLCGSGSEKGWVKQEAELRDQYRDLVKRARNAAPRQEVLTGGDLDDAIKWQGMMLSAEWALRQVPAEDAYKLVLEYTARSVDAKSKQERRRLAAKVLIGTALLAILGIVISVKLHIEKVKKAASASATARQLVAQARGLLERDSNIELTTLLAIESLRHANQAEGVGTLGSLLELLRKPLWVKGSRSAQSSEPDPSIAPSYPLLQFSASSLYVAQVSPDAKLHIYNAADGSEISVPSLPRVDSLAWDGDRLRVLVVVGEQGSSGIPIEVRTFVPPGNTTTTSLSIPCQGDCNFTADGKYLLVSGEGRKSLLYELDSKREISLGGTEKILGIRPVDKLLLRQANRTHPERLALLTFAGNPIGEVDADSPIPLLDMGGESPFIASAVKNLAAMIYRRDKKEINFAGQYPVSARVSAMALSPDGHLLALGHEEGGVRVVDWAQQSRRAVWTHSAPVAAVAFSHDGQLVASRDESGEVRVVSLTSSRPGSTIQLDGSAPIGISFAYDPSDRFLVARRPPGFAQLFDIAGNKVGGSARLIALAPDGQFEAVASTQGLEVLDLRRRVSIANLPIPGALTGLALGPGGKYAALVSKGRVLVLRVSDHSPVILPAELEKSGSPVFSPDGRYLAVRIGNPDERKLALLDCESWKVAGSWDAPWTSFTAEFSPDSELLFAKASGRITAPSYLFLETASRKPRTLALSDRVMVGGAHFSPDSRLLAVSAGHSVRIFDLLSGQTWEIAMPSSATMISFSRSGRYLGVGSSTYAPIIYDRAVDFRVAGATFLNESDRMLAFRFADDDKSVSIVSRVSVAEGTDHHDAIFLKQESLSPEELIKEACALVSRNLTSTEWKTYLPDDTYLPTCQNRSVNGK